MYLRSGLARREPPYLLKCKNHCHDNAGNAQYERQPRLLLVVLNKKGLDCGRQDQKTANNQQVKRNETDGRNIGRNPSGINDYERKDRGEDGKECQDVAIDTRPDIGDFVLFILDLFKLSGVDVGIVGEHIKVKLVGKGSMVRMGNRAFDVLECDLRDTLRFIESNRVAAYVCNTVEQSCSVAGKI